MLNLSAKLRISAVITYVWIGTYPETRCIISSLGNKNHGDPFGVYACHGSGGTQAWMSLGDKKLRTSGHENMCGLWENLKFQACDLNKGISSFDPITFYPRKCLYLDD